MHTLKIPVLQKIVFLGFKVIRVYGLYILFRLEELSEARQSVVNRVKAAEKERDRLEGAKAVAEAYLSKERECTVTQSTIFQIFVRDGQARSLHTQGNGCVIGCKRSAPRSVHADIHFQPGVGELME